MKRPLLLFLLLASCTGCASSSFNSSGKSKDNRQLTTLTLPISFIGQKIWGDYLVPAELAKEINVASLYPGDIVTFSFWNSGIGHTTFFPSMMSIGDYSFESVHVSHGLMLEASVIDGVVQLEEAGLDSNSFAYSPSYFTSAMRPRGGATPLEGLDKVFIGVTVENPAVIRGYADHAFRS